MIRCLDIHTHHPAPQPGAVVAVSPAMFAAGPPYPGQLYSVGIHPWDTANPVSEAEWETFGHIATEPQVVAIGECGIDKTKGAPLFMQMLVMKRQVEISEKVGKPLVIHDVKAHDIIIGIKKEMYPVQNWLVHGFRGKPTVAKMLTDAGICLSFGEKFNPDTLRSVPPAMILAETDESQLPITEIISRLSESYGSDLTELIARNTSRFLYGID